MNAIKFEKDGVSVWENGTVISSAIETINESFDLSSGFVREEKNLMFIKGNSEAVVARQVDSLIKAINSGKLATYRAFSLTPFYNGQAEDINPTTGATLGRYSEVRMCIADEYTAKNRVYVVNAEVKATAPVANEA